MTEHAAVTREHRLLAWGIRSAGTQDEADGIVPSWVIDGLMPFDAKLAASAQAIADFCAALTAERDETRTGYHALDKNWGTYHETCINAFRAQLEMPGACIPDMLTAIQELQQRPATAAARAHTCVAVAGNDCRDCGKDMPIDPALLVWCDGGSTFVVARSEDDAKAVYRKHVGENIESYDELAWELVPHSQPIRIRVWQRGPNAGEIAPADEESPDIDTVTRTAEYWAVHAGRGFLCTSEY